MREDASTPSVPPVDRAFGAVVTFVAASFVGYLVALLLVPEPTATGLVPAGAGVVVGLVATVALVFAGGYERLLVPIEGRRWAVELAAAFVVVAGAYAFEDVAPGVSTVFVLLVIAAGIFGSRYVGDGVADARGWYDHDDREN